jgi:hypothetical protein
VFGGRRASRPPGSQGPVAIAPDASRFRLLGVEAADPIRYRVLHRSSAGELTEDTVWSWSTLPSHLLATALSQGVAADPDLQMVETATAPAVAVTLLSWFMEDTAGGPHLVGAVEVRVTDAERAVHTSLHEAAVPVSRDLPGNLAVQAAQLLGDLAAAVRGAVREAT